MLKTVVLPSFLLVCHLAAQNPFEELCVVVSATAELGISGDFLCNFVILLWCDLDRFL